MTGSSTQKRRSSKISCVVLAFFFPIFYSTPVLSQCEGFYIELHSDPAYLTYCPGDTVLVYPVLFGGTGPYTYEWSTGGTDSVEIYVALDVGWYTASVTVTDANGCVAFGSIHIKPTFWNLEWWNSGPACPDDGVSLSVTADIINHTFVWSNGATGNPITVHESGTYTVTVTNIHYGCTAVIDFFPEILPTPTPEIIGPQYICNGQSAELSVDGSYSTYIWSTGQFSSVVTVNAPGIYSVTVTDISNGCAGSDSIEILPISGIPPEITFPPVICPEDEGTIAVSNTTDFIDFLWSTGATTPSISGSAPETYSVTVTDINGCIVTGEVTIEAYEVVTPEIVGDADICVLQETISLGIEQEFVEYLWSTGETSPEIEVTDPGIYEVTVTDQNGCTTIGTHLVEAAPIPDPFIQIPPEMCDDSPELLSVGGSGGPYTDYLWSTGENTAEIVIYASGTYTVTVTNSYGCVGVSAEETILIGTGPHADIVVTTGNCGESVSLTATGGDDYAWSTGDYGTQILVDTDGTYTVTVSNDDGCTDVATVDITITDAAPVEISGPDVLCPGDTSSITVTTTFAIYSWSTGDTGQEIQVTMPGIYTVTVSDASGCSGTDEIIIQAGSLPDPQITGPNAICDGETAVLTLEGNYPEVYWSTGESTDEVVVGPGSYWVNVSGLDGCTGTDSITVITHTAIPVSIEGPESICTGGSTTLTAVGDFNTVMWSTGASASNIVVTEAGMYTVVAVDSNGCITEAMHLIEAGDSLTPSISQSGNPCDGAVTLSAGQGYASYIWSNDSTTSSILVSEPGMYSVTVADASGCLGSDAVLVSLSATSAVQISGPVSGCADSPVILTATSGMLSYSWSTGDTTGQIVVDVSGTYTVTAIDSGGCLSTASHTYTRHEPPVVDIDGPVSFCTGGNAILNINGNFHSILWNIGDTGPQITVTQAGTYSVTVTDSNGCTALAEQTVTVADTLSPEIVISGSPCDGFVTLDAGTGYMDYIWSTGDTTSAILVDTAGIYFVSVMDPGGCSGADDIAVSFPQPVSLELTGPNALCEGTDGTITANPDFVQYLWSTGDTTAEITVHASGVFSVTVTDQYQCQATASHTITVLQNPVVEIEGRDNLCGSTPIALSINGMYETILWNTGATENMLTIQNGGYYAVTVTDRNGCTATANLTVTESQADSVFMVTETCSVQDTGTQITMLVNQYGCDSLIIEITTLSPSLVTDITFNGCAGEDVVYDGTVIPAGSVHEFVHSASNGCDSIVRVSVVEYPELVYELITTNTCTDQAEGTIAVHIQTGDTPCFYGLNGNAPTPDSIFHDLPAGVYDILVVDANGCTQEQAVEIHEVEPVEVEIEMASCPVTIRL